MGASGSRRVELGGKRTREQRDWLFDQRPPRGVEQQQLQRQQQAGWEQRQRGRQRESIENQLRAAQQNAESADGLVGPSEATAVHVRGRWPSGGAIELFVLALGDEHLPHTPRRGFLDMREFLQVASGRALERGVCVDAFLEMSMDRCVGPMANRRRADRSRPREITDAYAGECALTQAAWSLAGAVAPPHSVAATTTPHQRLENPLGRSGGARVHWFDSRPESCGHDIPCHMLTGLYYGAPVLVRDAETRRRWMRCLMGLGFDYLPAADPVLPADLIKAIEGVVGADATAWLVASHRATAARVLRRARKMDARDLQWLARIVVETQRNPELSDVMANTADFYLLLRMLGAYPAGPACGVPGAPRHCLVYAGRAHTDHVLAIMQAINSAPGGRGASAPWRGDVARGHQLTQKTCIQVSIEVLLKQMGLATDEDARSAEGAHAARAAEAVREDARELAERVQHDFGDDPSPVRDVLTQLQNAARRADGINAARLMRDLADQSISVRSAEFRVWRALVRIELIDEPDERGSPDEPTALSGELRESLDSMLRAIPFEPDEAGLALRRGHLTRDVARIAAADEPARTEALQQTLDRYADSARAFVRCVMRRS